MSNFDVNPAEVNTALDAASGLPGSSLNFSRDIFSQPLHPSATALDSPHHPLLHPDNTSDGTFAQLDPLTGLSSNRSTFGGVYGDEFESGIAPIDYTVHLAGRALDAVDQVVESSAPVIKKVVGDAVTQIAEAVHDSIDIAQKNWNASDNELHNTLNNRVSQAIGFLKKKIGDLSADPDVKEAVDITTYLGRTVAEKAKNFVEISQSATEAWGDKVFDSTYVDQSVDAKVDTNLANRGSFSSPFVGVIDVGFESQDHGATVVDTIQQSSQRFPDWLDDSVGTGRWAESLIQFVDQSKSSGRSGAIVNLSFDLTQINPDGSVSTRYELTAEEREALQYAQANRVLVVASAGNQGEAMSALGQASHEFDNVIAVGAAEGGQRAAYSSYGAGLDFVASGQGREAMGTSLAAARVTGAIAKIWDANPQLDYRQVVQSLESTAIDLQKPGRDSETGYGQLNTSAAIDLAEDLTSQPQLLSNSQLQNTIERDQAGQVLHNAIFERDSLIGQKSNGVIPSERPNRLLEGDGIQPESASNVANSPSFGSSSLDHLLKYEPGGPLQYDEHVKQWQQRMSDRGWNITVDGLYGSQSAQIARQFQQEKGLAVDGIVGPDTWAATFDTNNVTNSPSSGSASLDHLLKYEPGGPLQYDEQVKQWQQRMSDRGWNIAVDGFYGPQSAAVASQFQQEKGLDVDGIVGSQTWAATFDTTNVTGSFSPESSFIPALSSTSANNAAQSLIGVAQSYIGVREQGYNSGAQVEAFQRAVDGVAQNEAWCMSFAQYCIKAVEKAAQADSPIVQSEHCLTVWKNSPDNLRSSTPKPGSLVIWQHGNSSSGHVGIVESVNADGTFITVEGNTNDGSGVTREGIGVFRRQRDLNGSGEMRVVGFLNVFPDKQLSPSTASVMPLTEKSSNPGLALASDLSSTGELLKYEAGSPMRGDHVRTWQELLNKQGYGIQVDGAFGAKTDAAIREFQRSQNLAADGIVGPNTQEAARKAASLSQTEGLSLIPGIGDVFNTPTEPANSNPATSTPTSPSFFDGNVTLNGDSKLVTLKRYSEDGSLQAIDPNQETVVVVHGWKGSGQDENIQEIAREASRQGVQVLTLDWGSIAQAGLDDVPSVPLTDWDVPEILPPYNTAEWIAPVGEWAYNKLHQLGFDPNQLTLVGHSLGTYVSAELAAQFDDDKVKNLVALDPAFPANNMVLGGYDVDGRTSEQNLPRVFRNVADNSLSFVAKNAPLTVERVGDADTLVEDQGIGGFAGDSDQAATADNSFVVDFPEGEASSAHTYVVDAFIDALEHDYLTVPDLTLPYHLDNWYSDNGNKQTVFNSWLPDGVKGAFDLNHHEGRISADAAGEIQKMVRVVDDSGTEESAWT
ncbi:alpha/beta fold hydrolase [Nodosilinea sp. FACHB-13]|uniref:alpha/beta fold hydrolase n=1 Tax=Cyanophyceae TaxID=3028117 RepID=UPI0018EF50B2|nr:alpha/beta fold hydrolase [Nodosilinea sp. FACHB-13]